jgi:tRNA (guanine37-N1)-methyltransferase
MMKIDVLTIFPSMFEGFFSESIIKRAIDKKLINIKVYNLRDWTEDNHKSVDAPPFGGGAGMLMRVDVIEKAISKLKKKNSKIVLLDTKGETYKQGKARELSKQGHLILIVPHYEGVDHRVHEYIADEVISIGNFVLTGGEIPTMVVIDSVVRLLPGVLGNEDSLEEESFGDKESSQIEYPQYTRPSEYKGMKVPEILLSGDHKKIATWRKDKLRD